MKDLTCLRCGAEYDEVSDDAVCCNGPQEKWDPAFAFKKVQEITRKDGTFFQSWKGERYIVNIERLHDSFVTLDCCLIYDKSQENRYLPRISIYSNEGIPENVRIQTTSYGALEPAEFEKFIEAQKAANYDAKAIEVLFVNSLREGNFDYRETLLFF